MSINIICAINESFQIGNSKTNDLLYKISNDLKRFKELTLNSYVVMGRNTYESLPRPLNDRTNVIMTTDKTYEIENGLNEYYDIIIEHDLQKVLNNYKFSGYQEKDLNLIGGSFIFAEGIHWADKLFITLIHDSEHPNGDIYFPKQELSEFKVVHREKHYDDKNDLYYSYLNYERKSK